MVAERFAHSTKKTVNPGDLLGDLSKSFYTTPPGKEREQMEKIHISDSSLRTLRFSNWLSKTGKKQVFYPKRKEKVCVLNE